MKYFVYILLSENFKKTYTGFTDNIERRLLEHNSGKNYFTKRFKPWKLIHLEEFDSKVEATEREKYLKSAAGRRSVLKKLFN